MTHHYRQHPNEENTAPVYRAAILRGAISGAVRALITWLLDR